MQLLDSLAPIGTSSVIVAIGTLLTVWLIISTAISYSRLRHIPGPWYAGITPLWLGYHTLKRDVYCWVHYALDEYDSSIIRVAPNTIISNDPSLYKRMLAPRTPFKRGRWFRGLRFIPDRDNSASMTDEKQHTRLRSQLMPGYSGKEVTTLESDVDSQVLALVKLIQSKTDKNESFDFAQVASYFTLDTLTKIAFNHVNGHLANDKDMLRYLEINNTVLPILELSMNVPLIQSIFESKIMQSLVAPKPTDKEGFGALLGQAHKEVASRFGPDAKEDRNDMLGSFVRHGMTQLECESESAIQILAGSDSTAMALRTIFWHILTSPRVYSRLSREISAALGEGTISYPVIKDVEVKSLSYLQACIREGTRVFAPLNGLTSRVSPPGGFDYNGIHIPENTQIGIGLWSMARRKDIFGQDADTFRPERFVDESPENIKKYQEIQELMFGYGQYACLGRTIALIELGKATFELFRRFEFAVVDPLAGVYTASSGPVFQKGMIVRAWQKAQNE